VDDLLTIREIAELLRLNRQTVYWVDEVRLPAVRVGQRRVRIRRRWEGLYDEAAGEE
jgi:excisionase family DNA binding protein